MILPCFYAFHTEMNDFAVFLRISTLESAILTRFYVFLRFLLIFETLGPSRSGEG